MEMCGSHRLTLTGSHQRHEQRGERVRLIRRPNGNKPIPPFAPDVRQIDLARYYGRDINTLTLLFKRYGRVGSALAGIKPGEKHSGPRRSGRAKTLHPLHQTWLSMRSRCNNPNTKHHANYGGRGIRVCKEWEDFDTFVRDVGDPPGPDYTLDRIDVDGDYCPENVRWADPGTQARNTRRALVVPPFAEDCGTARLAEFYGVSRSTVYSRIRKHGRVGSALCGLKPRKDGGADGRR